MGHATSNTRIIAPERLASGIQSGVSRDARDQFEYGSLMLTRQGRYKAFTTAFSARPTVFLQPLRSTTGTVIAVPAGTPNVGSFNARLVAPNAAATAGTYYASYIAVGAR